jgi:hypothetical protein
MNIIFVSINGYPLDSGLCLRTPARGYTTHGDQYSGILDLLSVGILFPVSFHTKV